MLTTVLEIVTIAPHNILCGTFLDRKNCVSKTRVLQKMRPGKFPEKREVCSAFFFLFGVDHLPHICSSRCESFYPELQFWPFPPAQAQALWAGDTWHNEEQTSCNKNKDNVEHSVFSRVFDKNYSSFFSVIYLAQLHSSIWFIHHG